MTKRAAYLLVILSLFCASSAANAWSKKDTYWQSAYFLTHLADWGQTLDIANQCSSGSYYETNPVMGKCPSAQTVNAYFAATALIHYGVAHMLPPKYRRMFQIGTMGMQLSYIANNASIGLNLNF
ncbi:MAG TPA: hypothetical protein ENK06_06005 [Gammaproteobacteria bacterium]|nr:hypothetical protein [Gammaproteobacteria bacterium]